MTAEKTKEETAEAFEQIAIDHVPFFDSRPEDEREEYFSIIRDAYDLGQQQNAALIAELEKLKAEIANLKQGIGKVFNNLNHRNLNH